MLAQPFGVAPDGGDLGRPVRRQGRCRVVLAGQVPQLAAQVGQWTEDPSLQQGVAAHCQGADGQGADDERPGEPAIGGGDHGGISCDEPADLVLDEAQVRAELAEGIALRPARRCGQPIHCRRVAALHCRNQGRRGVCQP